SRTTEKRKDPHAPHRVSLRSSSPKTAIPASTRLPASLSADVVAPSSAIAASPQPPPSSRGSEPLADPSQAALDVRRPVREQAVVCLVPRCKTVVKPGPAAELGIDVPIRERAVEQPGVVEGGIAQTHVTPVDHAGEAAVAHEEMLGTEVGVEERRLEVHQRLRVAEESFRPCAPILVEEGEHEPFEIRALLAVGLEPVGTLRRKPGRVDRMERLDERADAVGILVDEWLAADQAVADEEGVAGDVLERGYVHQERRSERRQQRDLELERLFDGGASRKAEHPVVVDDCYLKVVSVADLDDRPRAAPKRFCEQPVAVGSHSPMVSDTTPTGDDFRRHQRSEV